ncbi:MAG: hypothetical protein Q7V88_07230 [Actinomycetota bacterium]|nr:hypothetical protein [Actinomycetota bacterium]
MSPFQTNLDLMHVMQADRARRLRQVSRLRRDRSVPYDERRS